MGQQSNSFKNLARALRLSFLCASILPFTFGSLLTMPAFDFLAFFLGLICAVACHLSANLINDYADSRSSADWQDKNFYGLFGGSKLIQEGVFSERLYLFLALFFAFISASCAVWLAVWFKNIWLLVVYTAIILLAWGYSLKPLAFSYRRIGELIIFVLFGPALVVGGYFLQARAFGGLMPVLVSLPFGLLTAAILFANEVPDFSGDTKAQKFTLVSLFKPTNAYAFYAGLAGSAFLLIILGIGKGYFGLVSLLSLFFTGQAVKAALILKAYPFEKTKLLESSGLIIALQAQVSAVLILDRLIWLKL